MTPAAKLRRNIRQETMRKFIAGAPVSLKLNHTPAQLKALVRKVYDIKMREAKQAPHMQGLAAVGKAPKFFWENNNLNRPFSFYKNLENALLDIGEQ